MKTPVLIVICVSAAVLFTLPALYLFLAYHTRKERQGWRVEYDKAAKRLEAEQQRNPRPRSTAIPGGIYPTAERGRAPVRAPARPTSAYNPRAPPPRPQTLRRKGPLRPPTPGSRPTASTSASSSRGRRRSSSERRGRRRQGAEEQQEQIALQVLNSQSLSRATGAWLGMAPSSEKETHAAAAAVGADSGAQDRGDNKLARKLLKPRRRAQIEVWLDETVSEQETQYCIAGREFGHRSDSSIPQPAGQASESPHSTLVIGGTRPVCGRSSEGEEGPSVLPPGGGPPPRLIEGKAAKYMLRGIRAAMGQFRARGGGKGGGGGDDDKKVPGRAVVSTAMFLAEASGDDDSSVATVLSSSGRFGGGEGKALEERMARLMRAQKLLEKSQARG